jgi:Plasmid pRiA4b ORF-3-like protein
MRRAKLHAEAPAPDNGAKILQFKIWLKGISPMIWRRVQTPASTMLRELHGIFQIAMGWEGIHLFLFKLRATHFGSWELCGKSPNVSLGELRLRKGMRFIYEYDLNIPWEHEVRLEAELPMKSRRAYPHCVEGHASCPPEDCRGIADFLARRDAWVSEEGLEDLAAVADFVDQVVLQERRDLLKDHALIEEMRDVLDWSALNYAIPGKANPSRARRSMPG